MKPPRGSNRDASKAPKPKNKETKKKVRQQRDLDNNHAQPKTARKRKAESSSLPPKIKGQENWKPMSASSVAALEKVMDLSILTTLSAKLVEKKAVQEHLNALKESFLDHCTTLKVPGHKHKLEASAHRLQEEAKKSEVGKQILSSLVDNQRAAVSALEENEQKTYTLEHQCSVLRIRLQDQEGKTKEIFLKREVLNLPPLHLSKYKTTLEARVRKTTSDTEAETMARKLGEILQNSGTIQDTQELLVLAHKRVDELFNPVSITPCLEII